jgi:hypothetical protein
MMWQPSRCIPQAAIAFIVKYPRPPTHMYTQVDCEKTAHNQALAQSSGISAFPTFHLYANKQRVGVLRGADPNGLRRAVGQQVSAMGSQAPAMASALASALGQLKGACSDEEFVEAARTLLVFVGNVVDNPEEAKYRRVKGSNAAFQRRVRDRQGVLGTAVVGINLLYGQPSNAVRPAVPLPWCPSKSGKLWHTRLTSLFPLHPCSWVPSRVAGLAWPLLASVRGWRGRRLSGSWTRWPPSSVL